MNKTRLVAAMKAVPGTRGSIAPQASGMGRVSPVASEMYYNNPYRNTYGPFLPRPPDLFSDGAFGPMPPIQPVPVDQPPAGGQFPDPRWWQYTQGWNLPTPPGTEGLKLASFDQLATLANKYSVARACIDLREQEIRGLGWEITFTKDAAKAYQGDHHAMREAGERIAKLRRFFRHPDPEYWTFDSFLNALLEEIFVYDALALIFRPKFGEAFGMGGRGLLNSGLDTINLVSGPTIRPLIDLHGGHPAPPAPAYQQFLYGVPRSDYQTMIRGEDIDDEMLWGAKYNDFTADIMMYDPYWPRRESPYGQPPVEKALLPIISGLQLQEYQLDYFTEGSVPAVYISPGDNNITPVQVQELQTALNGIAGDKAFHLKVVVLPPGSKVDPQRPVDLSSGFDELVMEQVCMAFDVMPMELGIIPDIGGSGAQGPSASSIRFASQEARDVKSRKSTKPLLQHICSIFNYVIQDICGCEDLQFQFEGLADDEDKQAITELGVQQVQNGIASIDEVRDRLDLPPWGLQETSEPVVFTAQGPIPFSMAPQLIAAMQGGQQQQQSGGGNNRTQGTSSGQRTASSRSTSKQPAVRQGGQTKPNGSHPAPVSPHRESLTPGHSAAAGAIQSSTPRTGGTTSRSSVAGSRKKAVEAELQSLSRHLRKGRLITTWEPVNIDHGTLARVAEDIAKGVLIDIACERAADLILQVEEPEFSFVSDVDLPVFKAAQWPGWEHDQDIVKNYKTAVANAFKEADIAATAIRQKAAKGQMFVNGPTLRSLISEEVSETFSEVLKPLWTEAYSAGYQAGVSLCTGEDPDLGIIKDGSNLRNFIESEGQHWLDQISRTGMKDQVARSEIIARTEVARAMNAGAIQAYRDNRVQMKHLLLAPDDGCDICKGAEAQGDIPLDSIFPSGGLGGPFHPNCRCVPAPAGIEVVPPQATKSDSFQEDKSRAAFLLLRSPHPETGKPHYLLQKRDDGSGWGMPGGSTHVGEHPLAAAVRECTEEIGDLPPINPAAYFVYKNDDGRDIHIFVCDVPWFQPKMNGATPQETHGTGWFRKKEIKNLDLHSNFRKQWDKIDFHNINKNTRQIVTENGEQLTVTDPGGPLFPAGARWPYPHRSDGAEDPHYGTAQTPEPPNDLSSGTHTRVYEDDDTDGFPKRRTRNQGPKSQAPGGQKPTSSSGSAGSGVAGVGSSTGVPPGTKAGPRPVVGSVPAVAPKPGNPTSVPPEAFDPDETVEHWSDQDESNTYVPLPPAKRKGAGGPSDYSDPNPVDPEHVMNMMRANFPESAIQWVKRARWIGPINIPWDRIDTNDIEGWAASHQLDQVDRFAKDIKANAAHVNPSVCIQDNDSNKAILIDGHHRALAHKKLGQPVLGYVGMIDPRDRKAAEETHSAQIHSGKDPRNKGV